MDGRVRMDTLPNELLETIFDYVQADSEACVSIDRRAYLSVESFKAPSPPLPAQAHDLASLRLVCRRFAKLGIPHQFTRVTTRFSKKGFARLEGIAGSAEVAKHVKKFSYMLPCFWEGEVDQLEILFNVVLPSAVTYFSRLHRSALVGKIQEQKDILNSRLDLSALKKALAAFNSLQHVQVLRLQDELDRLFLDFLRENDSHLTDQYEHYEWAPACYHGMRTLGKALLDGQSPFTRFSGPMMNPQSALRLQAWESPHRISALASQLTCLELHFDDSFDLDAKMRMLSPLFKTVFTAATGMLAVHIGFPSRTPLGLRLEDIFHEVRWEKLRAFGIQAWRLDAEEVIRLARRHRRTLRGLRLRDVLLKEPSTWKTVLEMLRREMEVLDWVSLRRIGYSAFFDKHFAGTMEVPPDGPEGVSESDDEADFPTHLGANDDDEGYDDGGGEAIHSGPVAPPTDHDDNDEDEEDDDDDDDDEHGPEADELAMDPDTPSSVPWCNCGRTNPVESAEDLGDNGRQVGNWQRKMWEQWVVGRCPEHSSKKA